MEIRGNFDGIANKFDANIYGTSKGRLRHQLLLHHLSSFIDSNALNVLDIGAGTGVMSAEFAQKGHHVSLVDISKDALKIAENRLNDAKNIEIYNMSFDGFVSNYKTKPAKSYDLILCHALLEWLENPFDAIDQALKLLDKNGVLSLSFFNQDAKAFNNLIYGNFDYVINGMPHKNTVRLNPHNAQSAQVVIKWLEGRSDLSIVKQSGIRCIHDYLQKKESIVNDYQRLFELEIEYGSQVPFMWLGKYFHVIIHKL
ncbi:methyltransferase domain-containing protein [Glaciecola petra]|uniref:tRNA 5-carboxymethoxyuridine methyltransferase n=1 Tax=Glaciecola petra TaxID=3075602 RepID=A0ABU2ZSN8_9ALTE|nr:methyltransferase domain-containing protein [Aestuariibacter sp. P117]MDT0594442.1 methyltransferase domain-containing protein [Aestuariibacter sp. P117]